MILIPASVGAAAGAAYALSSRPAEGIDPVSAVLAGANVGLATYMIALQEGAPSKEQVVVLGGGVLALVAYCSLAADEAELATAETNPVPTALGVSVLALAVLGVAYYTDPYRSK